MKPLAYKDPSRRKKTLYKWSFYSSP